MEALGETENRYSGIPAVKRLMGEAGKPAPHFEDRRREFCVTLANGLAEAIDVARLTIELTDLEKKIVLFCADHPRTRVEIAKLLGMQVSYAQRRCIKPLVERKILLETIPDTPRSPHQRYRTAEGVALRWLLLSAKLGEGELSLL